MNAQNSIAELSPSEFPEALSECPKRPRKLYMMGDFPKGRYIAMVGTRRPSAGAEDLCRRLVRSLEGTGAVVVSGLAQGIDSFCHEAALDLGIPTIAVLGQGLQTRIPGARRDLAKRILYSGGALVTELEGNVPGLKGTYPARNRIIAALSECTVIVESRKQGGSLITAEFALEFKKKLIAIPGDFGRETAEGTNQLLRSGKALPIFDPSDLASVCGLLKAKERPAIDTTSLSPETKAFYDRYAGFGKTQQELLDETGLGAAGLLSILTELELAGIAYTEDGFRYRFEKE